MSPETKAQDAVCAAGRSLFERGFTFAAAGNISIRLDGGGWLMTPTGTTMGALDPERLSHLDDQGNHVSGDKPTKEMA